MSRTLAAVPAVGVIERNKEEKVKLDLEQECENHKMVCAKKHLSGIIKVKDD